MNDDRDAVLPALARALAVELGERRVGRDVLLAPLTTFKVGGPADLFVEPRSADETCTALRLAAAHGVPVTALGGGSNVLVADSGVRGLVLRPRRGQIALEGEDRVRVDAAVTVNGIVRWLIAHGLSGLEAWAGTPGTIGGGIHGNAHWGGRLLSEFVESVRLASRDGRVSEVPAAEPRSRPTSSGSHGPDLEAIAHITGLSADEVVRRHVAASYRVFMLGFLPGFPYLGIVDASIAVPRLSAPRAVVPAGSVGIAERQTGIYPVASPGGWRLLGRTPIALFDAAARPPARLQAGDTVRFVPIDDDQYTRVAAARFGWS